MNSTEVPISSINPMSACSDEEAPTTNTVIAVQNADNWSDTAKQYSKMASKMPIVYYFSDIAAEDLVSSGDLSALKDNGVFLDVCAGPAVFSLALLRTLGVEQSSSFDVIVSDFAAGMVEAAREALEAAIPARPRTQFRIIDVQNIDLPSESVDVVGCMFGYFVPDRHKAFSEVCRVCKTAGRAVIGTWKYAGFAYILGEFLTFLGRTQSYNALTVAHCCADAEALREELLSLGFSHVAVHEHSNVFEMPLDRDALSSLLDNPMIKSEVASFAPDFLHSEWARFVRQADFRYDVDLDREVLFVTYTANIAIATK